MILHWWQRLIAWFRRKPSLPNWSTPNLTEAQMASPNRQMRRALERARRRRDKLVKPKLDHIEMSNKQPSPKLPRKKKKKLEEINIFDDPNDVIIADELVEGDGKGKVLFEESEFYGEFNFRDSILDQLDRYWFYIERMRKHSKESYDMYRQVGAVLVPHASTFANRKYIKTNMTPEERKRIIDHIKLSGWFKQARPSWGCVAYGTSPLTEAKETENDFCLPKFLYFTRYKQPPPEIQPMSGGDIYKLTVWWDTPGVTRKWGVPCDIPIFVSDDGSKIIPLKRLNTRMVRVGKKGNNFDFHLIPKRAWYFPELYKDWSAEHELELELHLANIFCSAMEDYEWSQYAMAMVSVTKGKLTATFGINPRRCSYFFRDRDMVVTVNGRNKRILHYVRAHIREDGTAVKAHFRGAHEFNWAGYKVLITIPGRDHIKLSDFNVPVSDEYWMTKEDKWVGEKEIGQALRRVVHGAPVKEAFKFLEKEK